MRRILFFIVGFALVVSSASSVGRGEPIGRSEVWWELLDRADSLVAEGEPDSALVIIEKAMLQAETRYDRSDTTVTAKVYDAGIWRFCHFRSYAEAESLFTRAVSVKEYALGRENHNLLASLMSLAGIYRNQRRDAEALPLYEEALALAERDLGTDHPYVGNALCALADLARNTGDIERADSLYVRSLSNLEGSLGPGHLNLGSVLNNLAIVYAYQEQNVEAERLLKRAVAIWEANLGQEHPYLANSLFGLASVQEDLGKFADVEAMYLRALTIYEKAYGPEHGSVAKTVQNLGFSYLLQNRFAEAERMFKRALAIFEATSGPEDPDVAYVLINLQAVCSVFGRDAEAARLLERALAIWEQSVGPENPGLGVALGNLAGSYRIQGRYGEADSLLKRVLKIDEKAFGTNHHRVAGDLGGLAGLYHEMGRDTEAESLYSIALAINEDVYGLEHPLLGMYLSTHAAFYVDRQKLAEAETLYDRSLAIHENIYGPESFFMYAPLGGLTEIRRRQGAYADAAGLAARRWRIMWQDLKNNGSVVSERDALKYARLFRQSFDSYMSCVLDLGVEALEVPEESIDIVLSSKGQVNDVILERQKATLAEADSTTQALSEALRYTKFRQSNLIAQGPLGDVSSFRSRLDSLSRLAGDLESDLAYRSARFKRRQALKQVDHATIVALLPENAALIEYVKYNYHQLEPEVDIPYYAVMVLASDAEPDIVQIGKAQHVEALVDQYREHMVRVARSGSDPTVVDRAEYAAMSRALYGLLVEPVEDLLDGKTPLFIAPDGALSMISFSGLMDRAGRYLAERQMVHYLSSGRDHMRFGYRTEVGTGLLAIGDPDYDADGIVRLGGRPPEPPEEVSYAMVRNVRSGCGEVSDIKVDPLPGSRKEIELVAASWERSSDEPCYAYVGHYASEDVLKALAPGKRVVHLATHGYFLEGPCASGGAGPGADRPGENPLLLSGLLFAGANLHGAGADSLRLEDGILTAYEVSAMDLEGTELVVLSACETGLGEVEEGEGVYGLRRAFQMAGARTVISALWPVSDEATADMMSRLYERKGESIPETMSRIQLERISELRRQGQPDHPLTWAGFIATGDWR